MTHIKVRLERSTIGVNPTHRATVIGLGLRRPGHESILIETPAVRGMLHQVSYLVSTEAAKGFSEKKVKMPPKKEAKKTTTRKKVSNETK